MRRRNRRLDDPPIFPARPDVWQLLRDVKSVSRTDEFTEREAKLLDALTDESEHVRAQILNELATVRRNNTKSNHEQDAQAMRLRYYSRQNNQTVLAAKKRERDLAALRKNRDFVVRNTSGKRVHHEFSAEALDEVDALYSSIVPADEPGNRYRRITVKPLIALSERVVDVMGIEKTEQIVSGIREEFGRGNTGQTGFVARRTFHTFLDATDRELQSLGAEMAQTYCQKSQTLVKHLQRAARNEGHRESLLRWSATGEADEDNPLIEQALAEILAAQQETGAEA